MSTNTEAAPAVPERLNQALDRLRCEQALTAGRIGTWWVDIRLGQAQWDAIAAELLGTEAGRAELGELNAIHPDDQAMIVASLKRSHATGEVHDAEFRIVRPDGEIRWLRSIARPAAEAGFGRRWLTGVLHDVTERRAIESALRESRRQLSTLVNNLPGVAYRCTANAPWQMDFVSNAVEEITGRSVEEVLALDNGWADLMHADDVASIQQQVEAAMSAKQPFSLRYRIVHTSGQVKWVHERGEATYDDQGQPKFLEGFIWDVTDQQAADERLQWTASHDGLTQLPNRAMFQQALENALSQAAVKRHSVGVFLLDLDHFKAINDTLGHDAGDALLRGVAERLCHVTGAGQLAARLSGDEFAVLVENASDTAAVEAVAERIVDCFHQPFEHQGRLFDCHGSLGLAVSRKGGGASAALMKDADIALYVAKAEGRGRWKRFEPAMRNDMQTRSSMLQLAREALTNEWVVPHYQPKVDLLTGQINGFEALLRWNHPHNGLQLPETIAAAFLDVDLAALISDRMIDLVIADVERWTDEGIEFGHIAINAAAAELRRGNFAEMLLGKLAAAGVPHECIQIEVTETVFLGRGAEYVETALRLLNASGIRIALDDFGTGFASLSHLKQFPVDAIKIDRSFVRDLHEDPDDAAIVRAVISLGRSLGIKIIAEGIETQAQIDYLRKNGCDFGQGYFFGAAVPAGQVRAVLAAPAVCDANGAWPIERYKRPRRAVG